MRATHFQSWSQCLVTVFMVAGGSLIATEPRDTMPDTWAATDALVRVLPLHEEAGSPKPNRTVGIFHFNWHAAFGNPAELSGLSLKEFLPALF